MKTLIKLIIGIPIICSFFIAIVFIGMGVYETGLGVYGIFIGQMHTDTVPGVNFLVALDGFLLGFLFIISSLGFTQLFIPKPSKIADALDGITPEWLKVENFAQLKLILWDTLLTTLVVKFLEDAFRSNNESFLEFIGLPVAIFLIAISKYLILKSEKTHNT